jgi:hypothetical protein
VSLTHKSTIQTGGIMKINTFLKSALATLCTFPARSQNIVTGSVLYIYADPSDFVFEMSVSGRCGSKFFHIQRSQTNFKEVVASVMIGFSDAKQVTAWVTSCGTPLGNDRNLISHVAVTR